MKKRSDIEWTSIQGNKEEKKMDCLMGSETKTVYGWLHVTENIGDFKKPLKPIWFITSSKEKPKSLWDIDAKLKVKLTVKETDLDVYCEDKDGIAVGDVIHTLTGKVKYKVLKVESIEG